MPGGAGFSHGSAAAAQAEVAAGGGLRRTDGFHLEHAQLKAQIVKPSKEALQQEEHFLRGQAGGERGVADNVEEQNGHLPRKALRGLPL